MNGFKKIRFLLFLIIILLFAAAEAAASPKYLIFHVDAVSLDRFLEELDAGNMPQVQAFFAEGASVYGALSLWPGGTEVIYPRLKEGCSNAEHPYVGWQFWDADQERWVPNLETIWNMFFALPRRSRMFSIYAHPPHLDFLAGMAMQNVPLLFRQYDVLEVFWFSTDHAGHIGGKGAHSAALHRFDHYFGKLAASTDLSGINVILYCDHGLTFPADGSKKTDPKYIVPFNKAVTKLLGKELYKAYYPNVYLRKAENAPKVAWKLLENVDLDWVLYPKDENTLIMLHHEGRATLHGRGKETAYVIEEGADPFHYEELGCQGEYLNPDQWLALTVDSTYPGAVPNIWNLWRNPNSGDVLGILNPPKVVLTAFTNSQSHTGLARTDLLVPILFKGPNLKHMDKVKTMWLHELYTRYVPGIPFDRLPKREEHKLSVAVPFHAGSLLADSWGEFKFSPLYRFRLGANWQGSERSFFVQYDLLRSFFSRWWLGLGVYYRESDGREKWSFSPRLELEWQYKRLGANFIWDYSPERKWRLQPALRLFTDDYRWSLEAAPWRIGLSHYW
ncbi:MAG: hypothetical protein GX335_04080 [Firmicutes bacterium]|nr:hypothetical protein [Bacillota bacterium]